MTEPRKITLLSSEEYKEIAKQLVKKTETQKLVNEETRALVESTLGTYASNAYVEAMADSGEEAMLRHIFLKDKRKDDKEKIKEKNRLKHQERAEKKVRCNSQLQKIIEDIYLHVDKLDLLHANDDGVCEECDLDYPCPTVNTLNDILDVDAVVSPKLYLAFDIPKNAGFFKAKFWGVFVTKKNAIDHIRTNLCFCELHRYHIIETDNPYTPEEKIDDALFCHASDGVHVPFAAFTNTPHNKKINYKVLNANAQ